MASAGRFPVMLMTGRTFERQLHAVAKQAEERTWARARESYEQHYAEMDFEKKNAWWMNLTSGGDYRAAVTEQQRQAAVKRSRGQFLNNPILGQAARLYFAFVYGRGITTVKVNEDLAAKDKGMADRLLKVIDQFWTDRHTQFYLSGYLAQRDRHDQLQRDGEVPILVSEKGGQFSCAVLDSLEVVDVIEHRTLPGVPVLWKRQYRLRDGNAKVEWYRAIEVAGPGGNDEWQTAMKTAGVKAWGQGARLVEKTPNGSQLWLYMVKANRHETLPLRGHPVWYSVLPWCAAVQAQVADLRTYCRALAAWAWKQKTPGANAAELSAAKGTLASTLDGTVQKPVVGSIRLETEGQNLEPISLGTGGANSFSIGIERSLEMVYTGLGLPAHYFAGQEPGGLTTADKTELRVRKLFEAEQLYWTAVYDGLFGHLARLADMNVQASGLIDIDFPALVDEDAVPLLGALSQAGVAGIIAPEDACRTAAYALGAEDVDAWVERLVTAAPGDAATMTEIDQMIESNYLKAAPIVLRWSRRLQHKARESMAKGA